MNRIRIMMISITFLLALGLGGCSGLFNPSPMVVVLITATPDSESSSSLPPPPSPTSQHTESETDAPILVDQVNVLSQTVTITFTVVADTALLFDVPELNGKRATPNSLETASFALLDRASGQATAALEFPHPGTEPPWTLVFNPTRGAGDYVAPRVEVEVNN